MVCITACLSYNKVIKSQQTDWNNDSEISCGVFKNVVCLPIADEWMLYNSEYQHQIVITLKNKHNCTELSYIQMHADYKLAEIFPDKWRYHTYTETTDNQQCQISVGLPDDDLQNVAYLFTNIKNVIIYFLPCFKIVVRLITYS